MATYSFGQKLDGSLGITAKNGMSTKDGVYAFDKGEATKMADIQAPEVSAPAPDVGPDFNNSI